jgi:hypothetical protein
MQTKAHNCVLVDGEGQPIQDITAKGETLDFLGGKAYTYWLGEAAGAYQGRLKKFRRHILRIRPDTFVIYDDLEAPQPATFQWLLHSLDRLEICPDDKAVVVKRGNARLLVRHLLPGELKQSQDDSFGVPPEARGGPMPNQWHYTAATTSKSANARFLTWLRAFEGNDSPLDTVRPLASTAALGLKAAAGDRISLVAFSTSGSGQALSIGDLFFDGGVAACETVAAKPVRFLLVNGRQLRLASQVLVESSSLLKISAGWIEGIFECEAAPAERAELSLYLGQSPVSVLLDGKDLSAGGWSYDARGGLMTVKLEAGEHVLEVSTSASPSVKLVDRVAFNIRDKAPVAEWGAAKSANNTQVLWGSFESVAGIYKARIEGRGDIWLNADRLLSGGEALVGSRNQMLVETPLGAPTPRITLEPLYSAEHAVPALAFSDDDVRLRGGIKIEAETYAEGIRGTPLIYSHRTFLSGGKGVSTPPTMGVGARWKAEIPTSGRYAIVLKVATHEPSAIRALTIDGRAVSGSQPLVRFPNTGSFGGTPSEWKHFAVGGADGGHARVELRAGPHVIELISVEGLLNLDYILLLPEQGK